MLDEAKNINKSLSALGNVIAALAETNVRTLQAQLHSPLQHDVTMRHDILLRFADEAHSVPRQQADSNPARVARRQRAHRHRHLLVARLLQRVRDQVHAALRTKVRHRRRRSVWRTSSISVACCLISLGGPGLSQDSCSAMTLVFGGASVFQSLTLPDSLLAMSFELCMI